MTHEEIIARMNEYTWYHQISLGDGIVTPGHKFEVIWDMIRRVRRRIDYRKKTVLDLGAWDGMWTFEAEQLDAKQVVAVDCALQPLQNFLFCREILKSRAIPYYNTNMYRLQEGLDVFINGSHDNEVRLFDIVQHLGILYHLRDPLLSLIEARSVMRRGGKLLLETAYARDDSKPMMVFNGPVQSAGRIYNDATTWWAPNIECLKEMLQASLFRVVDDSLDFASGSHASDDQISRISLIAEAIGKDEVDPPLWSELQRKYRNAGPSLRNL